MDMIFQGAKNEIYEVFILYFSWNAVFIKWKWIA